MVQMVKNPPANEGDARDEVLIPGLGRASEEGNCNPLKYSCLGNPMDRGTWEIPWTEDWQSTACGSKKSHT